MPQSFKDQQISLWRKPLISLVESGPSPWAKAQLFPLGARRSKRARCSLSRQGLAGQGAGQQVLPRRWPAMIRLSPSRKPFDRCFSCRINALSSTAWAAVSRCLGQALCLSRAWTDRRLLKRCLPRLGQFAARPEGRGVLELRLFACPGAFDCSCNALSMPCKRRVWSLSRGWMR